MGGHRFGLRFAVVLTVAAAGAATVSLRPQGDLIEPVTVDPTGYFTPAELQRAEEYRGPQRVLGLAGIAVSGAGLALIALRPPRAVRRALAAAGRRPVVGGAAAGAALSAGLVVIGLPLGAVAHARAVDVGLSTQSWPAWLQDAALSAAIGAVISALGAAAGLALVRRFPRGWWAPASALVVAFGVASVYLSPILIEPLFNRFTALPQGPLRTEVLRLADRAGVEVGEVYRVDASRRTTGVNAYVGGLGPTKRVVLYDNLIESFPPDQVRSVVAHELAHQHFGDLPRGLLWLAVVAPAGLLLVQRLSERVAGGRLEGAPRSLPALALAVALVSFGVTAAGNVLSRQVEARADAFALRLTDDPDAFVGLERRLALRNIGDPDPPRLLHLVFDTHPTTVERIGFGLAYARERP